MAAPWVVDVLAIGHVVSAIGWLGAGLLSGFVIGPGLQRLSPASRLEFIVKVIPRMLSYMRGMIVGTFVFGLLLLYFRFNGNFSVLSPSTVLGAALSAGIGIAVITAVLAFAFVYPAFNRMVSIANGMLKNAGSPAPPEMAKYATRARVGSMAAALLLVVAAALMVTTGFY